jgi:hypothetical protein
MNNDIMVSHDARALRLANKLRRRVKRKAASRHQRTADPEVGSGSAGARRSQLNRRLKDVIATLESRRTTYALVDSCRRTAGLAVIEPTYGSWQQPEQLSWVTGGKRLRKPAGRASGSAALDWGQSVWTATCWDSGAARSTTPPP